MAVTFPIQLKHFLLYSTTKYFYRMPVINVTITEIIILQSGGGERQEDSHSRMVLGKLRNLFKQTSNLL